MLALFTRVALALGGSPEASIVTKATVVLAAVLLGTRFARRARASVRHVWLASMFAVLLLLPAAVVLMPQVAMRVPVTPGEPRAATLPAGAGMELIARTPENLPELNTTGHRGPFVSIGRLLAAGWGAGVVAFMLPLCAALWRLRTVRRRGLPWLEGSALARKLSDKAGISRPVDVLLHEELAAPMTCGFLRPVIVLPADAGEWRAPDIHHALIHELEHVHRADWPVHLAARVACAAYWFHPLVWMAWRQLCLESERACDDAVLATSDGTAYAEQLVSLARRLLMQRARPVLSMANRTDLSARVSAVLDTHQLRGRPGRVRVWTIVVAVGVAALTLAPLGAVEQLATERPALAQSPAISSPRPAFDVTSVKPNASVDGRRGGALQPGRFAQTNVTLRQLIQMAYGPQGDDRQTIEGPGWIDSLRFDVEAKGNFTMADFLPGNGSRGAVYLMLQSLLEERFKLAVHEETRTVPVYALARARRDGSLGPELHRSNVDCAALEAAVRKSALPPPRPEPGKRPPCSIGGGPGNLLVSAITMPQFAAALSRYTDRPIVDRTGLDGAFDFKLQWTPDQIALAGALGPQEAPTAADRPELVTAIQEQLGLKLESTRGPVKVLVIDHLEPPTDNQADPPVPSSNLRSQVTPQGLPDWRTDETDHFSVFFDASTNGEVNQVKREIERAYNVVSAERRHDVPFQLALVVFATGVEMERGSSAANLPGTLGAVPPPDKRVLIPADMTPAKRSEELVRQIRTIFDRDIAASKPRAQADSPSLPVTRALAFAVASVKANRSGDLRTLAPPPQPGGRYTATNVPLDLLIALAYQPLQRYEIDGVPDWARSERFDIDAKAEGNPTPAQVWPMLQSLLAERFKLAVHREVRQLPVYALVMAKDGQLGPQLHRYTDETGCDSSGLPPAGPPSADRSKPLSPPPCGAWSGAPALGRLAGQRIMLDTFGRALSGQLGRMVIDRTGLSGLFDLTLDWTPQQPPAGSAAADASAPAASNLPSIFTAVQEQLGLKLVPQIGPVSVLVVDHVDRPTDN